MDSVKGSIVVGLKIALVGKGCVCVCLFPINNKDNPIALFGPGGYKTISKNILIYLILILIKTYIVYMCGRKKSRIINKGKIKEHINIY